MAIRKTPGGLPHVFWIDLKSNNVLTECAVFKTDERGNTHYMEIPSLDGIDKGRLFKILSSRNATSFPLWDLMSQVTLNNGSNALEYFHQLVKVITEDGVVLNPRAGHVGGGKVNLNSKEQMASMELKNAKVESVPVNKPKK